jgi:hypothetical protein
MLTLCRVDGSRGGARGHEATRRVLGGISTHGTGPSWRRPTLAKSEGGGAVRDGPLAKDAGPLPGGREQWYRCCSGQRYQQLSSRLSWWYGECTSSRQAGPGYWQLHAGLGA